MATWIDKPNSKSVLQAAQEWKANCLVADGSAFAFQALWTAENFADLSKAFNANPLLGGESFVEKLLKQIADSPPETQQLAAEMLWLLWLFVAEGQIGIATKRDRISRIWALSGVGLPNTDNLNDSRLVGIAKPGTAFMTKIPDELGFALTVFSSFKQLSATERSDLVSDPWRFGAWLDTQPGSDRRAFRHMLLYLSFPESYERISSGKHKRTIRSIFAARKSLGLPANAASSIDVDRDLRTIRNDLEQEFGTAELDFYLTPLREIWLTTSADEVEVAAQPALAMRQYWIEKTIVKGRMDRQGGADALGQALWSPQRSKNGGDIYANMRRVNAGDVIFHLTDNEALVGVSIAAAAADDTFMGLAGTEWEPEHSAL